MSLAHPTRRAHIPTAKRDLCPDINKDEECHEMERAQAGHLPVLATAPLIRALTLVRVWREPDHA